MTEPNAYTEAIEVILVNAHDWKSRAVAAEAEVDRLRAEDLAWRSSDAAWVTQSKTAAATIRRLEAEVERLRVESRDVTRQLHEVTVRAENAERDARAALPVLPDVGPVTRDGDRLRLPTAGSDGLGTVFHDDLTDGWIRLNAARSLAVLAKREEERAEAAASAPDTSRVDLAYELTRRVIAKDNGVDLEVVDSEWVDQEPRVRAEVERFLFLAGAIDRARSAEGGVTA